MQLLIIQVITFVGLLLVLRALFQRQLSVALARLRRLHEENLAREEELKKELEQAKIDKEKELAKAKEEAEAIIKEAKDKSEKMSLDSQAQAKEIVQKNLEQAKIEQAKLEKELLGKYQERAVELAIRMLQVTFTEQGKEMLQHQLISELLDEMQNLEQEKFTVKTKEIKILSAYPLSKIEREKLLHILCDKVGMAVELQEVNDPGIIMGLVVQIGALTIDGSLRNKLKKIIPYLKTEEPTE